MQEEPRVVVSGNANGCGQHAMTRGMLYDSTEKQARCHSDTSLGQKKRRHADSSYH